MKYSLICQRVFFSIMKYKIVIRVVTSLFLFCFLFQAKEKRETIVAHINYTLPIHSITTIPEINLNNLERSLYLLLTNQLNLYTENENTCPSKNSNESTVNANAFLTSKKQKIDIILRKIISYSATRHKNPHLPKIGVLKI